MAIHFWKWFIAKESLLAVEGPLIFRRQPALWEVSTNLSDGSHVPRWPHPGFWITMPQDDTQWPTSSNFLGAQTPLVYPPWMNSSWGNAQTNPGRLQHHSPPVNAQLLARNQHMDTHFLWVFLKEFMIFPLGKKKKKKPVGSKATRQGEATPTSRAESMQRDHRVPATPNFNLVPQPCVIKTAQRKQHQEKGEKRHFTNA